MIITENWIKPPKIVQYKTAELLFYEEKTLACQFYFNDKYLNNDFYINGQRIFKKGDMFYGKRYFFEDRFYSLLEYYSIDEKLVAYYIDITLPPKIKEDNVWILDIKLDFFIMPDKKTFFIMDQDELEDAINKNLFYFEEIEVCNKTKNFIIENLKNNKFDKIFTDYERGSYSDWKRYLNL